MNDKISPSKDISPDISGLMQLLDEESEAAKTPDPMSGSDPFQKFVQPDSRTENSEDSGMLSSVYGREHVLLNDSSIPYIRTARDEADFYQMMDAYEKAIEEAIGVLLEAKRTLEKSDDHSHTMIRSLTSRLKSPKSIALKLDRFHFEQSLDSIYRNLTDIAGIRIVCSYIYDIYALRRWLMKQSGFSLVIAKDYISNPKPSGYRSLHMIFNVPVSTGNRKLVLPVEMQIRTTAMDSWASLEHQLRYKKDAISESSIHSELKECAEMLFESDLRMQKIFVRLSWNGRNTDSEQEEIHSELEKALAEKNRAAYARRKKKQKKKAGSK